MKKLIDRLRREIAHATAAQAEAKRTGCVLLEGYYDGIQTQAERTLGTIEEMLKEWLTVRILAGSYDICIKPCKTRGWIERNGEAISGLWFENGKLTDYDGDGLAAIVVEALIGHGFINEADKGNY